MISDKEFLKIINGLYEQTKKGQANWYAATPGKNAFTLQLPQSVVAIEHNSPVAEPDYITFKILRGRNQDPPVAQRKVYDGDDTWDPLLDLFVLVSRRDTGSEIVVNDVLRFIDTATAAK